MGQVHGQLPEFSLCSVPGHQVIIFISFVLVACVRIYVKSLHGDTRIPSVSLRFNTGEERNSSCFIFGYFNVSRDFMNRAPPQRLKDLLSPPSPAGSIIGNQIQKKYIF